MTEIHWPAVVVSTILCFILGGFWYSPIFLGKVWLRESGGDKQPAQGPPARVFGLSFIFALVAAIAFASVVGPQPTLAQAMHYALLIGLGCVVTCFGINYQFSNRSTLLWLVDGGYNLTLFLIFGLVFGLWP